MNKHINIDNPKQLQKQIEKFEKIATSRNNKLSKKLGINNFWHTTQKQRKNIGMDFTLQILDISKIEDTASKNVDFEKLQERADKTRTAGIKLLFIKNKK